MKLRYEIQKDPILKKYIVWEMHRNYMVEKFRGYKYECIRKKKKLDGK